MPARENVSMSYDFSVKMRIDGVRALRAVLINRFGLEQYVRIMERVNSVDVSENPDFKYEFYSYYRIRGVKKDDFFPVFQKLKENGCKDFGFALEEVQRATKKIEPVYTSKMLATLDKSLPVLDRNVMTVLGINRASGVPGAMKAYSELRKWYEDYLCTDEAGKNIGLWKETFRDYPRYAEISDTKIIDFLVWGLGL